MRAVEGVHGGMPLRRVLLGLVIAALALSCSRAVPSDEPPPPPEAPPSVVVSTVPATPTPAPVSIATVPPLPTLPPLSAEPGGELLIECFGPPFSASTFDRPTDDELEAHPAAALLRSMIVDPGYETGRIVEGWWKIADAVTKVWYLGRIGDDTYMSFRIDFGADGWTSTQIGDCNVWPALEMIGLSPASTELDPDAPDLEPSSRTVEMLVTEVACTGGASIEDRLLQPAIVYGEQSVTIIVAAVGLAVAGDCRSNPPARLRVELREPLGDREVRGWAPPEGTGG
jgi:hypothetical protein